MEIVALEDVGEVIGENKNIQQRRNFDERLETARRSEEEIKLLKGKKKEFYQKQNEDIDDLLKPFSEEISEEVILIQNFDRMSISHTIYNVNISNFNFQILSKNFDPILMNLGRSCP